MTENKTSDDSKNSAQEPNPASPDTGANAASASDEEPNSTQHAAPPQNEQEQLAAKAGEYYQQLLRTMADFENFRKRAARERQEIARYASGPLLEKILPALDNMEKAIQAADASDHPSVSSLKTGVSMVFQQLKGALQEFGLEEIDATGQAFDPNLHEAVAQQETDAVPEGHVSEQTRKGYKLHDRLLRPASVVVAKAPASDKASSGQDTQ